MAIFCRCMDWFLSVNKPHCDVKSLSKPFFSISSCSWSRKLYTVEIKFRRHWVLEEYKNHWMPRETKISWFFEVENSVCYKKKHSSFYKNRLFFYIYMSCFSVYSMVANAFLYLFEKKITSLPEPTETLTKVPSGFIIPFGNLADLKGSRWGWQQLLSFSFLLQFKSLSMFVAYLFGKMWGWD